MRQFTFPLAISCQCFLSFRSFLFENLVYLHEFSRCIRQQLLNIFENISRNSVTPEISVLHFFLKFFSKGLTFLSINSKLLQVRLYFIANCFLRAKCEQKASKQILKIQMQFFDNSDANERSEGCSINIYFLTCGGASLQNKVDLRIRDLVEKI